MFSLFDVNGKLTFCNVIIILNSFAEEESENVPSYYTIGSLCVTGTARVVKCLTPKPFYLLFDIFICVIWF